MGEGSGTDSQTDNNRKEVRKSKGEARKKTYERRGKIHGQIFSRRESIPRAIIITQA